MTKTTDLWERKAEKDHLGLKSLFLPSFYPLGKCVSECVCVCVLAYKGAPLLAHVSMCVCVHLRLCVTMPDPTLHERSLSDL